MCLLTLHNFSDLSDLGIKIGHCHTHFLFQIDFCTVLFITAAAKNSPSQRDEDINVDTVNYLKLVIHVVF